MPDNHADHTPGRHPVLEIHPHSLLEYQFVQLLLYLGCGHAKKYVNVYPRSGTPIFLEFRQNLTDLRLAEIRFVVFQGQLGGSAN